MKKFPKILLWILFFPVMLLIWGIQRKNKIAIISGVILSVLFIFIGTSENSTANTALDTDNTSSLSPDIPKEDNESKNSTNNNLNFDHKSSQEDENSEETVVSETTETENFNSNSSFDSTIENTQNENQNDKIKDENVVNETDNISDVKKSNVEDENNDNSNSENTNIEETSINTSSPSKSTISIDNSETTSTESTEIPIKNEEIIESTTEEDKKEDSAEITNIINDEKPLVKIVDLNHENEYIVLQNITTKEINLKNWMIVSVLGEQKYVFEDYILSPEEKVKIGDTEKNNDIDLYWLEGKGIWNNSETDLAKLYNPEHKLIDTYDRLNLQTIPPKIEEDKKEDNIIENSTPTSSEIRVEIIELDKKAEYITLKNNTEIDINLKNWKILSVRGEQEYIFAEYILQSGKTVKIGDTEKNNDIDLYWLKGRGIWNNSKSDPAELYDNNNTLIDKFND